MKTKNLITRAAGSRAVVFRKHLLEVGEKVVALVGLSVGSFGDTGHLVKSRIFRMIGRLRDVTVERFIGWCRSIPRRMPHTQLQSSWCSIGPCARRIRYAHKVLCYPCNSAGYDLESNSVPELRLERSVSLAVQAALGPLDLFLPATNVAKIIDVFPKT